MAVEALTSEEVAQHIHKQAEQRIRRGGNEGSVYADVLADLLEAVCATREDAIQQGKDVVDELDYRENREK